MFASFSVLCLAGPTGCGKTDLAITLAHKVGGEIVNGDSRQLYADFPIVTAQPDAEQRRQAPHHLYGVLPTEEKMSAGDWMRKVVPLCEAIRRRGNLPIITGGTGFYFEVLLHGLATMPPVPPAISATLAARMAAEGSKALYEEVRAVDPAYAARIHPHDRQRILRALEVYEASGKNFSWWHSQGRQRTPIRGPLVVLGTSLTELEPRLSRRLDEMLRQGALREISSAWEKCPHERAPGWTGIGCRELLAYHLGKIGLDECRRIWLASTRAYAKRQLTWFRGRKNAVWMAASATAEDVLGRGKLG